MKKFIILLMLCISFAFAQAQTITVPGKLTAFGTAADTLIASAVKTYTFNVLSDFAGTGNILFFSDQVSGTPAFSAVLRGSIDGLLYVPLGTIAHSGGGDKTAYFSTFPLIWNKMKIVVTATSGTQKSRLYGYGVLRY